MAFGDLKINLSATLDAFKTQLTQAQGAVQTFAANVSQATAASDEKFKAMGLNMATLKQHATTLGTGFAVAGGAIVAGLGIAVKAGAEFEQEMAKVKAVTGATGVDFQTLRQLAIDLGVQTIFSAKEAAQGIGILGQAGFTAQQIVATLPGVLALAAAGELSLAQAADIAVKTLDGFGLSANQAGHLADVLAVGAQSAATTVGEMGEAFKFVAPVAVASGAKVEEMAAAIATLSNQGIVASMAGTDLRRAISEMINPSEKEAEAARLLGLTFKDTTGHILPLNQILDQLKDRAVQGQDFLKLFGDVGGTAMLALANKGGQSLRDLTTRLEHSDGAAKAMAETMRQNLLGSVEELQSSVETLLIVLSGDSQHGLQGVLSGVVQWVTKGVNALTAFAQVHPQLISFLTLFTGQIGLLSLGLGGLLLLLPRLIETWRILNVVMGLSGGTIGVVLLALGELAAIIALVISKENEEKTSTETLNDLKMKQSRAYVDFTAKRMTLARETANLTKLEGAQRDITDEYAVSLMGVTGQSGRFTTTLGDQRQRVKDLERQLALASEQYAKTTRDVQAVSNTTGEFNQNLLVKIRALGQDTGATHQNSDALKEQQSAQEDARKKLEKMLQGLRDLNEESRTRGVPEMLDRMRTAGEEAGQAWDTNLQTMKDRLAAINAEAEGQKATAVSNMIDRMKDAGTRANQAFLDLPIVFGIVKNEFDILATAWGDKTVVMKEGARDFANGVKGLFKDIIVTAITDTGAVIKDIFTGDLKGLMADSLAILDDLKAVFDRFLDALINAFADAFAKILASEALAALAGLLSPTGTIGSFLSGAAARAAGGAAAGAAGGAAAGAAGGAAAGAAGGAAAGAAGAGAGGGGSAGAAAGAAGAGAVATAAAAAAIFLLELKLIDWLGGFDFQKARAEEEAYSHSAEGQMRLHQFLSIPVGVRSVLQKLFEGGDLTLAAGRTLIDQGIARMAALLPTQTFFDFDEYRQSTLLKLDESLQTGIQTFARGGIALKPTFGVFGERGPEVLAPLAQLPELLSTMARGPGFPAMSGGGGTPTTIVLNVQALDAASAGVALERTVRERIIPILTNESYHGRPVVYDSGVKTR